MITKNGMENVAVRLNISADSMMSMERVCGNLILQKPSAML